MRQEALISWLTEHVAVGLLSVAVGCVTVGAIAHAAGGGLAGEKLWMASGAVGVAYSGWMTVDSLRSRRLGVDVIALLALVGALAVGEYLAAGVIGVMVTSGRALEAWAAGRAHRDLSALLERAPRVARRYEDATLRTVPVSELVPGDRLVVGSGAVVATDGLLLGDTVLDESALTGESLPVERAGGDPVRSGVVNVSAPFDMRVTVPASQSSYAGVVRLVAEAEKSQAPFLRMADRYALWFLALTLAGSGAAWALAGAARAVAVLVVATPCPLILAAPVAMVAGLSTVGAAGGSHQRWWSPRTVGRLHHAAHRQDRHPDHGTPHSV